jgi:hypothetical protein
MSETASSLRSWWPPLLAEDGSPRTRNRALQGLRNRTTMSKSNHVANPTAEEAFGERVE